MDVNGHERLFNVTLRHIFKQRNSLFKKKDKDVNGHERLFNVTLRHTF